MTRTEDQRFSKIHWEEEKEEEMHLQEEDIIPVDVPKGGATKRLSILNIDWDAVDAEELYRIVNTFADEQEIVHVSIYKTAFGKKVLEIEEVEGPNLSKDAETEEQSIRKYLREKMKYFYAVVEFTTEEAAKKVYEAIDELEIGETFNFLDLRFIPEEYQILDEVEQRISKPVKIPKIIPKNPLYRTKAQISWDDDTSKKLALIGLMDQEEYDMDLANDLIDVSEEVKKDLYEKIIKSIQEENNELSAEEEESAEEEKIENEVVKQEPSKKRKIASKKGKILKKPITEEIVEDTPSEESEEEENIPVEKDERFQKEKNNPDFIIDRTNPAFLSKQTKQNRKK
ncbi:hypothetical protein NEFER03_2183 [Nematocida sp. LUAm3]|nr:hypothetical protein NEFER03_2183 [Nematocida sp. LUAm3]KAI5176291.1 hypothetical protein NEFER02_2083 [Nematocida sp. LUAm2]KAI5179237.1 hypothetical protein NEFER01_2091 [Nematocida sp. LUAm1]